MKGLELISLLMVIICLFTEMEAVVKIFWHSKTKETIVKESLLLSIEREAVFTQVTTERNIRRFTTILF